MKRFLISDNLFCFFCMECLNKQLLANNKYSTPIYLQTYNKMAGSPKLGKCLECFSIITTALLSVIAISSTLKILH